jgi:hypothetical protein
VSDPTSSPSGWFPDPLGRHEHRYFNGTSWTADVADGGQRHVDPFGAAPTPGPVPYPDARGFTPTPRNGIATAAMVCGIIGVLLAWVPFVVVAGFVLAVLAIVFGLRGLRRSSESGVGRSKAITGVVTGAIAIALSIVGVVLSVLVVGEITDFAEPGPVTVAEISCAVDGSRATVTGELTNRSSVTRDYNVFVTLDDTSTFLTIDDVAPGATAGWDATVRIPIGTDTCDPTVDVYGPFPFGIEIDP